MVPIACPACVGGWFVVFYIVYDGSSAEVSVDGRPPALTGLPDMYMAFIYTE
jgi:hypothetical protein